MAKPQNSSKIGSVIAGFVLGLGVGLGYGLSYSVYLQNKFSENNKIITDSKSKFPSDTSKIKLENIRIK